MNEQGKLDWVDILFGWIMISIPVACTVATAWFLTHW